MIGKQIEIVIDQLGNVKIDAKGFSGCGCTEATQDIELVLGGAPKTKKKPEFYSSPTSGKNTIKRTF